MNVIKFPVQLKKLSIEEEIALVRQEILAEVKRWELQGLYTFEFIVQESGQLINLHDITATGDK